MAQLRADFQEVLQVKEEQEEALHRRERELSALKGALKEEVETHDSYMAALKDEYESELEKLLRDFELAKEVTEETNSYAIFFLFPKAQLFFVLFFAFCVHNLLLYPVSQSNTLLGQEKVKAEEERGAARVQLKDLILERDQLRGKMQEQSSKVDQLNQAIQECKTTDRLLEQRAKQLEVKFVGKHQIYLIPFFKSPFIPLMSSTLPFSMKLS